MIAEFFSSWALFHNTYVAGWLIALVLSLVGVVVVARDQIFIGAAVSQASSLGIALGMWGGAWLTADPASPIRSELFLSLAAVLFAVLAALATMRDTSGSGATHEATTGWVFLGSASVSILVLARSPHGLEEIHHLLSSSIIGATRADVWLFGALAAVTIASVARAHQRLILFVMDPAMAAAVGMRTGLWATAVAAWLGLVIGLSMRVSGLLYTFGCLVLPALIASNTCREVRAMLAVAPLIGIGAGVSGFVLANHYDDPPAQTTVAVLSAVWLLARLWRRVSGSRSAG